MFSFSCANPFAPVYFNWVLCNSPFFSENCIHDNSDEQIPKNIFSPILVTSASSMVDTMEPLSIENKQQKRSSQMQKCETEDEEYTPGQSQFKKMKKNQQNENRNIIPNIVNQILSYIQKKNKSQSMTEKIFEKINYNSMWSIKRFYLYQSMLKNKISHYVNEQTMRIYMKTNNVDVLVYSEEEQAFYNKVSRVLIFHFLNTDSVSSTLTSKRMDKSKKQLHIQAQRELTQKLSQIYKLG